jgi:hypothetical protein
MHPQMIWTRNNFFLLVQGALLSVVSVKDLLHPDSSMMLTYAVGFGVAIIWCWVTIAGRNLQRQWREIAKVLEKQALSPVKGPLTQPENTEGTSKINSITLALIWLSGGFIALWIALFVIGLPFGQLMFGLSVDGY